jgi:hypothetical protein
MTAHHVADRVIDKGLSGSARPIKEKGLGRPAFRQMR